jgi:hypothetical protein
LRHEVEWNVRARAKLGLDLSATARLRVAMAEDTTLDEWREIVSRLFYLITAACEDGAALAAQGQARGKDQESLRDLTDRLHGIGQAITILSDAIGALADL